MKIYLAGGITGNLISKWKDVANSMKLHLAQLSPEKNRVSKVINIEGNKDIKIHLAGNVNRKDRFQLQLDEMCILESYYYITKQEWMFPLFNQFKSFMLDSGAFTFMSQEKKEKIDWDKYVENYGKFVRDHNIELFFELDIDSIVGIEEVERLRKKLERIAGKSCIPVWHKSRGKEYWLRMIKEYDYVAIGGIVSREIKPSEYKYFHWLISKAHENNCKVHGLGFTNLKGMTEYKFDSVDSTSWLSGNRFGAIYRFNGKTMEKASKQPGQRVKNTETASNNFREWVKFSIYADKYL